MSRPVLTAVNHYCLFPFNHGGSLGIRGLYKALSEWFDINIVAFVVPEYYPQEIYINKHIRIINIPLPEKLKKIQRDMYDEYGMSIDTMFDSSPTVVRHYHEFDEIVNKVKEIAKDSTVVLAEHVFTWNIIKKACGDKHLWYRANNVEYDYKVATWKKLKHTDELLQEVYEIESECCKEAEKILAVSSLEIDRFMELYDLPSDMKFKFMDIHSGYDIDKLTFVLPSERNKISPEYEYTGLFVSSDGEHTRKAADRCIYIAEQCPDIQIVLLGSIGRTYLDKKLPPNVVVTGIVTDEEKRHYLSNCDFALNIMEDGAGINVKMFEYFAFGIPVISTSYGARGIDVHDDKDIVLTNIDELIHTVRGYCNLSIDKKDYIARNALELLQEKYSWRSIGRSIANVIEEMYGVHISEGEVPLEDIDLYQIDEMELEYPSGKFYIRCAGLFGQNCLRIVRKAGLEPEAFIDMDPHIIGTKVQGIPVISVDQFLSECRDSEVIVANAELIDIAADLIKRGFSKNNVYLLITNGFLTRLVGKGKKALSYYDGGIIKQKIFAKVNA